MTTPRQRGWGGKREGAGRPLMLPNQGKKIVRSVVLAPATLELIERRARGGEPIGQTIDRLLARLQELEPQD